MIAAGAIKRLMPGVVAGFLLVLLGPRSGWADTLAPVISESAQQANDSVGWAQLGGDGTTLSTTIFDASSAAAVSVIGTLNGPNSVVAVACPAEPTCRWAEGFAGGDTLVWTADAANGGNGPVTLSFGTPVSGAGALIQADGPGQFTVKVTAFRGASNLGSFTQVSDTNGDATYLGVTDSSGPNITSVEYQLTACAKQSDCADFALDTLFLNDSASATPTPTPSPSPSASITASPTPTLIPSPTPTPSPSPSTTTTASPMPTPTATVTSTPTATATATATPTPIPALLKLSPASVTIHAKFDSEKGALPKSRKVKLTNKKNTAGGTSISIASATVGAGPFSASTNCNNISLAPGKSCDVTVTFTPPATAATVSDFLTVTSDAANGPMQQVPVTGVGKTVN